MVEVVEVVLSLDSVAVVVVVVDPLSVVEAVEDSVEDELDVRLGGCLCPSQRLQWGGHGPATVQSTLLQLWQRKHLVALDRKLCAPALAMMQKQIPKEAHASSSHLSTNSAKIGRWSLCAASPVPCRANSQWCE